MLISSLKWPELAKIAPSFMRSRWWRSMTLISPVTVTKMSPIGAASMMRHNAKAIHDGLEGAGGINFGDDDIGAHALRARGDALAAPAIARDDEGASRRAGSWWLRMTASRVLWPVP